MISQKMPYSNSSLLKKARARSLASRADCKISYEQMAELFRRFSELDRNSHGGELARLQNFASPVATKPGSILGRIQFWFFRYIGPVLGRFLRAVVLRSPYQAAYDLAVSVQKQQLEIEWKMRTEIACFREKLDAADHESANV